MGIVYTQKKITWYKSEDNANLTHYHNILIKITTSHLKNALTILIRILGLPPSYQYVFTLIQYALMWYSLEQSLIDTMLALLT
jgi:hypothetical protein